MEKTKLYWSQPLNENLIETAMLVLVLCFLLYVVKLAFFERDD